MLFFIFSIYDEAAESLHQLADKLPVPGNLFLKTNLIGVYHVSYWSKNSSGKSIVNGKVQRMLGWLLNLFNAALEGSLGTWAWLALQM